MLLSLLVQLHANSSSRSGTADHSPSQSPQSHYHHQHQQQQQQQQQQPRRRPTTDSTGSLKDEDAAHFQLNLLPKKDGVIHSHPSCVHRHSFMELRNTHPSDPITIFYMESQVSLDNLRSNEEVAKQTGPSKPKGDTYSIIGTHLKKRMFRIDALSAAVIPLTLFPQVPSYHRRNGVEKDVILERLDTNIEGNGTGRIFFDDTMEIRSSFSRAAILDIAELAQKDVAEFQHYINSHSNSKDKLNFGKDVAAYSKLIISTSRGIYRWSFPSLVYAVTDDYALPNSLFFLEDGTVRPECNLISLNAGNYSHLLMNNDDDSLQEKKSYTNDNTKQSTELEKINLDTDGEGGIGTFEYNLFIDNPSASQYLKIYEVSTNRPDLFELIFDYKCSQEHCSKNPYCGTAMDENKQKFCQSTKAQDLTGPIIIAPKRQFYIATIRLKKSQLKALNKNQGHQSLGRLRLRTFNETLSIRLDYIGENNAQHSKNDTQIITKSLPFESKKECEPLQSSEVAGGVILHKPDTFPSLYHPFSKGVHNRYISTIPSVITIGLLPNESRLEKRVAISLTNNANIPLRLTRGVIKYKAMSMGMEVYENEHDMIMTSFESDTRIVIENDNISMSSVPPTLHAQILFSQDGDGATLQPGETTGRNNKSPVEFTISPRFHPDHMMGKSNKPIIYKGSVLFHFCDASKEYLDWIKDVTKDPIKALDLVVEVPFTANFLNGNVEYDVRDVYFPQSITNTTSEEIKNPDKVFQNTLTSDCTRSFDRTLRFKNSFPLTVNIVHMQIQMDTYETDRSQFPPDYCAKRFQILGFEDDNNMTIPLNQHVSQKADSGEYWTGISVRYFYSTSLEHQFETQILPKTCTLRLITDLAGEFEIPLRMYSGNLQVKAEDAVTPIECMKRGHDGIRCLKSWQNSTFGMSLTDSLEKTFSRAPSVRKGKKADRNSNKRQENWLDKMKTHMWSMAGISEDIRHLHSLEPIVMSLGGIGSDSVNTYSIEVTNHNPTPITLTAAVPAIEGMEVRLGLKKTDFKKYLNDLSKITHVKSASGEHQKATKRNYLMDYLTKSDNHENFFNELKYRDDIVLSPTASSSLKYLYYRNARVHMRRDNTVLGENRNAGDGLNHGSRNDIDWQILGMFPPGFTNSTFPQRNYDNGNNNQTLNGQANDGALLALLDGSEVYHLRKRTGENGDGAPTSWLLPPGSVARLELIIRCPPKHALLDGDFTEFISSGIVLRTNFGQIMPVIVAYRALTGQVIMTSAVEKEEDYHKSIQVPAIIKPKPLLINSLMTDRTSPEPEKNSSTPIIMQNTFSHDITLKKVQSCNSWFQVRLNQPCQVDDLSGRECICGRNQIECDKVVSNAGIMFETGSTSAKSSVGNIVEGSIYSSISCQSFYHCALTWLQQPQLIQMNGCDNNLKDAWNADSFDPVKVSTNSASNLKSKAINTLQRAVSYLDSKYRDHSVSTITQRKDIQSNFTGLVSSDVIEVFSNALNAWNDLSRLGMNIITGNILAHFEINRGQSALDKPDRDIEHYEPYTISTTISSPYLTTSLEVPRIFDSQPHFNAELRGEMNVINFDTTLVSEVSEIYIPIANPTGFPLRARLSVPSFLKGGERGGSNSKIISSAISPNSIFVQGDRRANNPWWTGGAYYLVDDEGSLIKSTHNVTIIKSGSGSTLSLVNPSLHALSAFVNGCVGRRCGFRFSNVKEYREVESSNYSPIGASASNGVILRGRSYDGTGKEKSIPSMKPNDLHPFALGSKSLDEVVIEPFGTGLLGPISFRPPSRSTFSSVIHIENSMTGFESVHIEGKGGIEKIAFADVGASGGDVELRYGKPSLVFPGPIKDSSGFDVRSVVVANVGDTTIQVTNVYLSTTNIIHTKNQRWASDRGDQAKNHGGCHQMGFRLLGCHVEVSDTNKQFILSKVSSWLANILLRHLPSYYNSKNTESEDPSISEGFSLAPHETKLLHISHTSDCNFRSLYVSLNLEYYTISKQKPRKSERRKRSTKSSNKKSLQLLVGYELKRHDKIRCDSSPRLKDFVGSGNIILGTTQFYRKLRGWEILIANIPLLIFSFILVDIFNSARQRRIACKLFQQNISGYDKGSIGNNWSSAYRCLSKSDPTSAELEMLRKEQTRQILLAKFRQRGILPSQCFHPNGTFTREKNFASPTHGGAEVSNGDKINGSPIPSGSPTSFRRSQGGFKGTLSEALFSNCHFFDESLPMSDLPVFPCGIGYIEDHIQERLSPLKKEQMKATLPEQKKIINQTTPKSPEQDTIVHHPVQLSTLERSLEDSRSEQKKVTNQTVQIETKSIATKTGEPASDVKTNNIQASYTSEESEPTKPKIQEKEVNDKIKGEKKSTPMEDSIKTSTSRLDRRVKVVTKLSVKKDIPRFNNELKKKEIVKASDKENSTKEEIDQPKSKKSAIPLPKDSKSNDSIQPPKSPKPSSPSVLPKPQSTVNNKRVRTKRIEQNTPIAKREPTIGLSKHDVKVDKVPSSHNEKEVFVHKEATTTTSPVVIAPPPGFSLKNQTQSTQKKKTVSPKSSPTTPDKSLKNDAKLGTEYIIFPEASNSSPTGNIVEDIDETIPHSPTLQPLLPPLLQDLNATDTDESRAIVPPSSYQSKAIVPQSVDENNHTPLLGLGQGFDVANFLNMYEAVGDPASTEDDDHKDVLANLGISVNEPTTNQTPNDYQRSSYLSENENATFNYDQKATTSIPSNPWGATEKAPRALAYGIEVDQSPRGGESVNNEVNFLTPALILEAKSYTYDEGDPKEGEDYFLGNSFYSSLLEEET